MSTQAKFRLSLAVAVLTVVAPLGCQTAPPAPGRGRVAGLLAASVADGIAGSTEPCALTWPPGVSLDDGLSEDEAVLVALWNNAAFQELLVELDLARGDLIQAGLLPNPEVVYFLPVSDKPFKYLADMPIEALWLRPIRVRGATFDAERTAARLAQAGLDLMRDVRQAYADVVLADERVRIIGDAVRLRGRIAELAARRLDEGDISPQEATTARIDALQAQQEAVRIGYDVDVMKERLANLLGTSPWQIPLDLQPSSPPAGTEFDVEELTQYALDHRPDALAADEAVGAAAARWDLARIGWFRWLGILDSTSGVNGHEFGPAARWTLPLFQHNQGGIARAEGELERAVRNQQTVANQIILDVRRSHVQYRQANAELRILRNQVRPEIDANIRRAQTAYEEGHITLFVVLESTRQLIDAELREAQLLADVRRTWAELQRSVARHFDPVTADELPGEDVLP